jgi:heptosyltransferase-3
MPSILPIMRKRIEKYGKRLLQSLLGYWLGPRKGRHKPETIRRILIFRLDGRVGNGILLLPLAGAIAADPRPIEVDILINKKVADFFAAYGEQLFHRIWPWEQKRILQRPWLLWRLIRSLRSRDYDIVLSSTNPDAHSVSNVIFGRIISSAYLVGFDHREAHKFYDLTVSSSAQKHYAEAMLDLWRPFSHRAQLHFGQLRVHTAAEARQARALFWLGATGGKHLPADLVSQVSEAITRELALDVTYAIGPDDQHLLSDYPTRIRAELLIDPGPLIASAQLFHRYKIFVSTDTGPMHFAVAIGLPALIIFTQAKHKQYGYNDGRRLFTTYYDGRKEQQAAFATWLADSLSALKGTIR